MTDEERAARLLKDLRERLRRMRWLAEQGEDAFFAVGDDGERNRGYGQMLVIQVSAIVNERLDADFRERYPRVPWQKIAGMRNRLAHEYDVVADEVVWSVLTVHGPAMEAEVFGGEAADAGTGSA